MVSRHLVIDRALIRTFIKFFSDLVMDRISIMYDLRDDLHNLSGELVGIKDKLNL